MKTFFLILITIWMVASHAAASAFSSFYQTFNNLDSKTKALSVRCFAQDSTGMMWFGTARGLYSYDGYDVQHYTSDALPSHQLIKCCIIHGHIILLGGENGVSLFDLRTGRFSKPNFTLNETIRAFCEYKGEIWIGAESGIYIYNVEKDALRSVVIRTKESPKNIQALVTDGDNLYIGMTYGVGHYSFSDTSYRTLTNDSIVLASCLLPDKKQQLLWAGTATSLIQIDLKTAANQKVKDFFVVKTIGTDQDGNLLIGTDNGLHVYDSNRQVNSIFHDARNASSLAGDVVNCIFKDRNSNIWIGTDNGISLAAHNKSLTSHSLPSITHSGEGNQIFCMHRATTGSLWLGGSRGLIKIDRFEEENRTYRWFQMNLPEAFIPHNRIRALYEDSRHRLWVATDRGLLRYNTLTDRFITYLFEDSSNWIYDILEVPTGDLWIATFDGVYCISSEQSPEGGTLHPKYHFSYKEGLFSNDVYQLALDSENNLWVLVNNHHIDCINLTTKTILPAEKLLQLSGMDAYALLNDSSGNIWISDSKHLLKVSVNKGNFTTNKIKLSATLSTETFAMDEVEKEIWITTSEGLFMVDKEQLKVRRIGISEKYISIAYDRSIKKVWLGTTNKLTLIDPAYSTHTPQPQEIKITTIEVNGNHKLSYSACRNGHIRLSANQNNLSISFSDFQYADEKLVNYAFKLKNYHSQWMELNTGENSIMLPNLAPGNYELCICPSDYALSGQKVTPLLHITLSPPWYLSWPAKCFYLLLLGAFIWWIAHFIIVRQQLHKERELRRSLMEQAKLKMKFFTNIAHEFKTPLSLIIAPSGKLLHEEQNKENKALLELIHDNAQKLSSLIHLSIEAYQDKEKVQQSFMPTEIEFVEFSRSIFDSYKGNVKSGLQDFIFDSNRETIYAYVDIFKMESILNNLLANACKFTPEDGSIMLSLEYDETTGNVYVKIADTGIGIPEEEIPYIFQRYYQSSRTAKTDQEGTGVGLSIVKDYVEIHKGSINVTSDKAGTTILLTLPIGVERQKSSNPEEEATKSHQEDTRPLIVIVEDNISTANFIYSLLNTDYRCILAHNGKNGLKLCMDLLPDLIIADVMMPLMDGIEMCHNIRQYMPLATVPIILLTAKNDSNMECQSIQLNIDAFIAKPFEYSLLIAKIRQLLGNKERLEKQVRIEHIKQPELKGEISADEKFLIRVTKVIEEHLDDSDLSVNVLAQIMDVAPKQLYRKTKQLTGMSTVEYIRSIRLKKAALLFHNGNFTVAEVMYMVGFSNASYFTRCFVSEFGKTPMEYLTEKRPAHK